jgi:hypothetical protein
MLRVERSHGYRPSICEPDEKRHVKRPPSSFIPAEQRATAKSYSLTPSLFLIVPTEVSVGSRPGNFYLDVNNWLTSRTLTHNSVKSSFEQRSQRTTLQYPSFFVAAPSGRPKSTMPAQEYSQLAMEVNRSLFENLYMYENIPLMGNSQTEPKSPACRKAFGLSKDSSPKSVMDQIAPIVVEKREFPHAAPQTPVSPEAGFEFELIDSLKTPPRLLRRTIDPPMLRLSPSSQRPLDPVARFLNSEPSQP